MLIDVYRRNRMLTGAHGSLEAVDPNAAWNITKTPFVHWYEEYVIREAARLLAGEAMNVKMLHVVGCGAGREIPAIRSAFPAAVIVASDISPAMIEICRRNLKRWDCVSGVELVATPASTLPSHGYKNADLVVATDNLLTYITPEEERRSTLSSLRSVMRMDGVFVGAVHHRWGKLFKSTYFFLQAALVSMRIVGTRSGDRKWRIGGNTTLCHHFTKDELSKDLAGSRFEPLSVLSLYSLARKSGRSYNPLVGDNNLVFVARAR